MFDLGRAQISPLSTGAVRLDDPVSGWTIRAYTDPDGRLRRLHVDLPDVGGALTVRALRALPVAQITHAARSHAHQGWPNETFYRLLALPKPAGQRHWDQAHWQRVLAVYDWARSTGRPGGGVLAVAQMWGVAVDPTAYRWLRLARGAARAG